MDLHILVTIEPQQLDASALRCRPSREIVGANEVAMINSLWGGSATSWRLESAKERTFAFDWCKY